LPIAAANAYTLAAGVGGAHWTVGAANFAGAVDGAWFSWQLNGVGGTKMYAVDATYYDTNPIYGTHNLAHFLVGGTVEETTANARAAVQAVIDYYAMKFYILDSDPASLTSFDMFVANGTGGDATVTDTDASGDISWSGANFSGGSDYRTQPLTVQRVLGELFPRGSQVNVYRAPRSAFFYPDFADFVDANISFVYRNLQWGNLSHM
jgi:hypothetical protein